MNSYNLQTVTKKHRRLFKADFGCHMFQLDLSGADGWTVAAHCARLGDTTMLDDYKAGLKPARIVAVYHQSGEVSVSFDRAELRARGKEIDGDGWLYFGCKRVQHGVNYGMKEGTMSDQILKDSYKMTGEPIYVAPHMCAKLAQLYLRRYPGVLRWQNWCNSQLRSTAKLAGASGHTRMFFGRREDHGTLKEYLADEPQENTTYAVNKALLRLWNDPENRRADGNLIIEPLQHGHDAIVGQFPMRDTEWAKPKLRDYFNNELFIAGQRIVIPAEGGYGPSWGECKEAI